MSNSAALAPSSRAGAAVFLAFSLVWFSSHVLAAGHPDYADALAKSLLFFQGQRSGRLPPDQAVKWRSNSAMSDGSAANVDLTGGYYDGGDNVKFNFPMAFTTTMLSWSIIEYGGRMEGRVHEARAAVRWATDYLLKSAKTTPGKLYVGVGDADADHRCWERPEDMDTPRSVYAVSPSAPGSDVAGETAAALAAASVVFRAADPAYSRRLVAAARDVMAFAWQHQGKYSDHVGGGHGNYYPSYSGYKDELLWGSAWLLRATKNSSYLDDLVSLGANDGVDMFSWDNKLAGARVLLSRRALLDGDKRLEPFTRQAEEFICRVLPNSSSPSSTTAYTPGGLMHRQPGSVNMQYVASASFLLTTYAKYMAASKPKPKPKPSRAFSCQNSHPEPKPSRAFSCQNSHPVTHKALRALAKRQVDYVLGDNPLGMSYMVGYGARSPQRIHHRASSMPSVAAHPARIGCQEGFQSYLNAAGPNPSVLVGAVVGGPDQNDAFPDDRADYARSEPTTYTNAPLVGCLAYFAGSYKK